MLPNSRRRSSDELDHVQPAAPSVIASAERGADAATLVRQFGDDTFQASDLVNLANYKMAVKLMIDGGQSKPFSARTMPPTDELAGGHLAVAA